MNLDTAKWYLKDHMFTGFNSDVREAVRVVLEYVKELEDKVIELEKTKEA